jgi:signal transduction histidine kinase
MNSHARQTRIADLRREIADYLQRIEHRVLQLIEGDEEQALRVCAAARDLANFSETGNPRHTAPIQSIPVVRPRADNSPSHDEPSGPNRNIKQIDNPLSATLRRKKPRSEERRRDSELARVTDALEKSREDLQQFAYAASHDLQAPVRTITTYLQLLERRLGDRLRSDEQEMIGYAQSAAKRMHKLILDLLLYSRAGTEPIKFERVNGEELLAGLARELRAEIAETGAELTWEHPFPTLFVSSSAIVQVLHNLIDNAIKYRRDEAPRIHVSIAKEADHWRISVRDNGQGIAPEHTKKVFEMLQRLHGDDLPGSGIGLATCQRLVERLGGKIWVDSEVGRGSNFCFSLPFQTIDPAAD